MGGLEDGEIGGRIHSLRYCREWRSNGRRGGEIEFTRISLLLHLEQKVPANQAYLTDGGVDHAGAGRPGLGPGEPLGAVLDLSLLGERLSLRFMNGRKPKVKIDCGLEK